jgi:Na+-driven multidrug efflux pump
MVSQFWSNLPSVMAYLLIVELVGVTTALTAMFASVMFHKTATSLMTTYLVIVGLFAGPVAIQFFAETFLRGGAAVAWSDWLGLASPFAGIFNVPLAIEPYPRPGDWTLYAGYIGFTLLYNVALAACIIWLFTARWRVSE